MTSVSMIARAASALSLLLATAAGTAGAAGLAGSRSSMTRQHGVALERDYAFSRTEAQVRSLVDDGELVRVAGTADFVVDRQVAHPYARPEVRSFLERLGAQYHAATGERLVVTSLTRPVAEQPRNASRLSVHPAGMAVDLRVPANAKSRAWLEQALLGMEKSGVLDVTRERRPPHYHVAVFPVAYAAYAAKRAAELAAAPKPAPVTPTAPVAPVPVAAVPVIQTAQLPAAPDRDGGLLVLGLAGLGLAGATVARFRTVRMVQAD